MKETKYMIACGPDCVRTYYTLRAALAGLRGSAGCNLFKRRGDLAIGISWHLVQLPKETDYDKSKSQAVK